MNATMTDEHLYTIEEVAKILRVKRRTVRKIMDDGDLPSIRVRNQYRIPQSALEAYMRSQSLPHKKEDGDESDID